MERKATVYIFESQESGSYYIGSTTDIWRRMAQHKAGHTPSTKRMGAMKLVFQQEVASIKTARLAERRIKRWKRKDYIEKIIEEGAVRFLGP